MAKAQPRGTQQVYAGKAPSTAGTCPEDDDGDRCSYEEQRDKRVANLKEAMRSLVQANKIW